MHSAYTLLVKIIARIPVLALLAAGVIAGYVIRGSAVELNHGAGGWIATETTAPRPAGSAPTTANAKPKYACSMFCLPPQDKPGRCAACGMEMVEVAQESSGGADDGRTLTLSPKARKLAAVRVAPVERKFVSAKIRMVGSIDYDEYDKYRNAPIKSGQGGRTRGRAVARLGVTLDAYESDLAWIRLGQEVTFDAESCPGETFTGKVVFIDGKLDNFTRTVDVRVRVPRLDERLKLGMLVRAEISATVGADGRVVTPKLGGRYICPMHEDQISNQEGTCALCGMRLRAAEWFGHRAHEAHQAQPPLVIPVSAPLITGQRAVVYVTVPDSPGTYEGRTIVLGPRAGDYYVVRAGLKEGEEVVVNGNFKIDSALQILARSSMMSPQAGQDESSENSQPEPPGAGVLDIPEAFRRDLDRVLGAYFAIHTALSRDDVAAARQAAQIARAATVTINPAPLAPSARQAWQAARQELLVRLGAVAAPSGIAAARAAFEPLSESMHAVVTRFGASGKLPIHRFHCPMAFDNRGAYWLQRNADVENPYFGSGMFRCGRLTETISDGAGGT